MAGSGDLDSFKIFRVIRKIIDKELSTTNYGFYQAIHHAVGILFLGGGGLTINSDIQSLALIYISIFPIFATNTNDNDKYLQALRHLYVLTCETKILETREIESNQIVRTDIVINYKNGESVGVKTPFNVIAK
jgi:anaphase-promoting complex subunit 1